MLRLSYLPETPNKFTRNKIVPNPHLQNLANDRTPRSVGTWGGPHSPLLTYLHFRCITYHSANECLFSASPDSFKVHLWEPHRTVDSILMGWGKIRDIAVASTQLVSSHIQFVKFVRAIFTCGYQDAGLGTVGSLFNLL